MSVIKGMLLLMLSLTCLWKMSDYQVHTQLWSAQEQSSHWRSWCCTEMTCFHWQLLILRELWIWVEGCYQTRRRLSSRQADRETDKDLCFTPLHQCCVWHAAGSRNGDQTVLCKCLGGWILLCMCVRAEMATCLEGLSTLSQCGQSVFVSVCLSNSQNTPQMSVVICVGSFF